jgi:DNA-binding transcriptional LysR family regulator
MELRQLRSLLAIAEETTFVRAAERLRLAQPALSRQIHSLEKELGTDVFERGRTGVTPTIAGVIALSVAKSITAKVDEAVLRARMADAGRVGSIRLYASVWALWTGFSGRLVAYLAGCEPGISVSFEEAGTSGHWGGVQSGEVDLAIATKPMPHLKGLVSEPLIDDTANVAILSKAHRLAKRKSIRLDELTNEPFLFYDATVINRVDHDVFGAFQRAEFKPSSIRDVATTEALMALIAGNAGWSIHRQSLAGHMQGVAVVPIEGFGISIPVTLVHRRGESRAIVRTVAKRIRELAKAEFPERYIENEIDAISLDTVQDDMAAVNNVELRDLRYFAAVVEEQTIGQAAVRLGKSQPAVSRQIGHLERDIGAKLFIRAPRGISPTPAAESLYQDALIIIREADSLPSEVERGTRGVAGRCRIATVPSLQVRELVASVLGHAAKEFPHMEIVPINVTTPMQPPGLQSGELDIGLCHPFSHLVAEFPDIDCRLLIDDVINGALLSAAHPLAKKNRLTFEDLTDVPFIFVPREFHPAFYDFVMENLAAAGYRPTLGPLQEGLHAMWSLTREGGGWSLAFGSQPGNSLPGLVSIPVDDLKIPWGVNILTRKDESRPTALTVIQLIENAAKRS